MANKLGIDLGTTNILVFVPGRGIVLNEPSVVAVSEDNKILAIGTEAKNMIGRTPENIIAYRPMKDGVIADYRVTEAMLRYYIDKALGKWNIFKPDVLISVPAGVTSTERRAVVEAAIKAGAKNAYVVKEPILAAIGAGIPIQEATGHMIVDIGGGKKTIAGPFPRALVSLVLRPARKSGCLIWSPPADIHNHVAGRFLDGNTGTNGRQNRFLDHINVFGSGLDSRFNHRASFG